MTMPKLPEIPEENQSPQVKLLLGYVDELVNTIALLKEENQLLKDEIAKLKGQKPKPKIPPGKLENPKQNWRKRFRRDLQDRSSIHFCLWSGNCFRDKPLPGFRFVAITNASSPFQARFFEISCLAKKVIIKTKRVGKPGQPRGTPRRKKKTKLQIHDKPVIQPANIPEEAVFKGYKRFTVQDLILKAHNTEYQLARWQLSDGSYISGEVPDEIHGHYGPTLISHILHQYHSCRVTEGLLLDQLRELGILISAGQLNNILIENKDSFREEVAELLPIAVQIEGQVQTDDTGGRHNGKNQYTNIIGNRWFSIFTTTDSKCRINFLKILQGGKNEYLINEDTLDYLQNMKVPSYLPGYIALYKGERFTTEDEWKQFLQKRNITQDSVVRFVTEAALYASVIESGIPRDLGVHSDDAGQFDIFRHSLCWIHEERHYRKLIMTTEQAQTDLERVRDQIWNIYSKLKTYKENPDPSSKKELKKQFDEIFQQETSSPTLNKQLKKTFEKKEDLLKVLERPDTPLHNNMSETDARSAKIKLKISGGTRSDLGREVRDIFLSLKQTCLKLGVNFTAFINDRVRGLYKIPKLADVIRQRSLAASSGPPS